MRVKLSDERKSRLVRSIRKLHEEEFDRELSEFQAERLLSFFLKELGPSVYNQAIQDAYKFMQDKLTDLEGEFYEPDEPASR